MKKKVFSIIGVAVFAVAVAFNINVGISKNAENEVTLANVEALAMGEGGDCDNGCLTTSGHCWCKRYYPYKEAGNN